ncbi:MAG: alanine--glyoxylate aminotransferase family protein [Acidobacteria bacterium]|nr:alanine--glyoxylate aminotransferase family protein [Acidobacteriota bacterium]
MSPHVHTINFAKRLLMGPGPSEVDPRVYRAMIQPVVGHMDPAFLEILGQLQQMLRDTFRTANTVTLPIPGTGSAGMEAALINFIEPGDEAAVVVGGVFASRMCEILDRCGAKITRIDHAWGTAPDPGQVRKAVAGKKLKLLGIVHSETSTGVCTPLEPLAKIAREAGALMVVDTVSSLGGIALETDAWGLDVVYSGTQKCLACPPGLAPITLSQRALDVLRNRKQPVQSWYLDLSMVEKYWGPERSYHHTPPVNMIFAFHEALRLLLEEGLDKAQARHRRAHLALVAGMEAMGLRMFVNDPAARAATVNTICVPEGIDDAKVRGHLLQRYAIEIAGGLAQLKGRIWRVGLMGLTASPANVLLLLSALDGALAEAGHRFPRGAGAVAAEKVFAAS